MKAIIILALIGGAIFFGVVKVRQVMSEKGMVEAESKVSAAPSLEQIEAKNPPDERQQALLDRIDEAEKRVEQARLDDEAENRRRDEERKRGLVFVYTFRNRQIPEALFSSSGSGTELFESAVVDLVANAVVFRLPDVEAVGQVQAAMEMLDKPGLDGRYRVEAVLLNCTMSESDSWSLEWLFHAADLNELAWTRPVLGMASGEMLGLGHELLDAALTRTVAKGAASVLSRPSVLVSPGVTAVLSSGREVPVPVTNLQDGNAQTSVEFRTVALEIAVTLDLVDGRPRLHVEQRNDEVSGTAAIGEIEVPELATQRWESTWEPALGDWYAVGGVRIDADDRLKRRGLLTWLSDDKRRSRREVGLLVRVIEEKPGRDSGRVERLDEALNPPLRARPIAPRPERRTGAPSQRR